jgi:hypothetical protein
MALKILYTAINGTLTADISAGTQLLPVDANTLSIINANLNFTAGDWTYLTLTNDIYSEEVKVYGTSTTYLLVVRAQSGSTAQAFSHVNTTLYDHVGSQAIQDIIAANPSPANVAVAGQGIATATSATVGPTTTYTVDVVPPAFTTDTNLEITGIWPNLEFSFIGNSGNCGCGGGSSGGSGSGVNELILNSPILTGNITGAILTLGLTGPTFTGSGGVTVTGSWAAGYTISGAGGGGTGTVQQVLVGTGLSLSGTPTVNPTLSLSNTGVVAGTYGAMTFNAQGQLTNITGGFAPVGNITLTNGGNIVQVGSTYNITLNTAAVGVYGLVELADSSASFNPSEDTKATTSKVVAQAIAALSASVVAAGSSTGEASSAYTNTLSTTSMTLTILAGETALLIGEVEVIDTAAGTPAFGVAVLVSGGGVLYSSRICVAGKQCIVTKITATMSSTVAIATTALAGTQSVTSATLAAVIV